LLHGAARTVGHDDEFVSLRTTTGGHHGVQLVGLALIQTPGAWRKAHGQHVVAAHRVMPRVTRSLFGDWVGAGRKKGGPEQWQDWYFHGGS